MSENVVIVDGDTVTINQKVMESMKIYWFQYKGERYGAYKDEEGRVVLVEEG